MSIKNSNPFRVGSVVGAVIGFLGSFMQIEPNSLPLADVFLNALGYALFLGVVIGLGFSGAAGRTHSHAVPHTDETDYGKYSNKNPPTTKVLDGTTKHNKKINKD